MGYMSISIHDITCTLFISYEPDKFNVKSYFHVNHIFLYEWQDWIYCSKYQTHLNRSGVEYTSSVYFSAKSDTIFISMQQTPHKQKGLELQLRIQIIHHSTRKKILYRGIYWNISYVNFSNIHQFKLYPISSNQIKYNFWHSINFPTKKRSLY